MPRRQPSMRELLADPAAYWHAAAVPEREGVRPVVAMSRQPGARGGELARVLGRKLGLQVFDREIIHRIAESAHSSDRVVAVLDEKERSLLTEWLMSLSPDAPLSSYGYFEHLTHVVASIARLGGAVILGRGAHLILRPGQALRVMVVAPLEERVRTVARREGIDLHEAQRLVAAQEAERHAFLKHYFRANSDDQTCFDLVVNTSVLGLEEAAEVLASALVRLPAGLPAGHP